MLYVINNKCYVNISPSIYVEVKISDDKKIQPTSEKIEINSNTHVEKITLDEAIKRFVKTETPIEEFKPRQKHNRHKR